MAVLVVQGVGALMYVVLPIVWLMALGWAGHSLNAEGGIGHMSKGIGQAAGGGVRLAGKAAKSGARMLADKAKPK